MIRNRLAPPLAPGSRRAGPAPAYHKFRTDKPGQSGR